MKELQKDINTSLDASIIDIIPDNDSNEDSEDDDECLVDSEDESLLEDISESYEMDEDIERLDTPLDEMNLHQIFENLQKNLHLENTHFLNHILQIIFCAAHTLQVFI